MSNAIRNSFIALAAILAFAGTSIEAQAQRTNNNRSSTNTQGGSSGGGQVILLGQPGNCPPTIACAPTQPREPEHRRKPKLTQKTHCDDIIDPNGARIRRCMDR